MYRNILILIIMSLSILTLISCNQETPVTQQALAPYSQDDAVALYMLGNEEPIEAEHPGNFLLNGPGPFFLWALDLTEEQKVILREIGDKYRDEMRSLHMQARQERNREGIKAQHEELRQAMMEEILDILTDGQKVVLEQIRAQIEAGQFPEIVIEKRVAHLTERLDLTADQQIDLAGLMAEYGAKMLQIRNEEKDPRTCHLEGRAIMQEYREAVKALLTVEQLVLFENLKAEFRANHPHRGHRPGAQR